MNTLMSASQCWWAWDRLLGPEPAGTCGLPLKLVLVLLASRAVGKLKRFRAQVSAGVPMGLGPPPGAVSMLV
ncbi:hypothetical protein NDU88_000714 [Pleurodeles waltl]|uniref:Uncharacterized protein n=1 Tax=Pleurodeles waltl TaxID=8319 RepID=A0AAV7Q4W7_PLEWA|nr:hypothetical protein NDU88_000714 [Pleurodeles waltl]